MIVNMNYEYNDINQGTKMCEKHLSTGIGYLSQKQEECVCLGETESGTEHSWNSGETAHC